MPDQDTFLTVAISSRALFDLDASDQVFRNHGLEAYRRYQIDRENDTLEPGDGFHFVKKLLKINGLLGNRRVDIILLSRNSADTGLRVFNSIHAHQLDIVRAAFSSGESPYRYAQAFGCDLFLSTEPDDVRRALGNGIAAATLLVPARPRPRPDCCASPSTAMPSCSPIRRTASITNRASRRSSSPRPGRPISRCKAGRSSPF